MEQIEKVILTHKHHIIPRHMGGADDQTNIIVVTIEKHANLHKQLWEDLHDIRDYVAWKTLSGQITKAEAQMIIWKLPKTDEHKKKLSIAAKKAAANSTKTQGRPKGSKNKKPYTQEILQKKRERMLGENHPMYGRKGKDNPTYGRSRPDLSERNRLNPPAKGKPKSEEWKQKNRKPKRKKVC